MSNPMVLIIDDDVNFRKTLADILGVKGYDVMTAGEGVEGIALLRQHPVNLVLIDLGLPDIPGIDLLDRVKTGFPATEAIIMTGNATLDSAIEATNRGAFSYQLKPCAIDQLLLQIKRAMEKQQMEEKLRTLSCGIEQSPASIVITDQVGCIEYVNPKFSQLTGYSLAEAVGQNPRILKSGLTPTGVYRQLWDTITAGGEWRGELCNRKKNGDLYWESASISPITDAEGKISRFIAVKEDVTARKQLEEERERLILELQDALARVKTLSGMLPICAGCKKIRDDKGYWNQLEAYISDHSEALFSHGLCPDCLKKAYEDLEEVKKRKIRFE
ncbi:MAG: PAS domain S-box protein [Geobacteraceae bacterium]|nr:PAS domain S-box protein [Geobacteraceae bacterium]